MNKNNTEFFFKGEELETCLSSLKEKGITEFTLQDESVLKNKENPSKDEFSGREEPTAAAQLEIGAIMQTGAAVESIIYASIYGMHRSMIVPKNLMRNPTPIRG